VIRPRVLAGIVILLALLFMAFGGEYGTFDWFELRAEERAERVRIAELERRVDSLAALAKALERDPRAQERKAREEFGMIRKGEHVYRLLPDSGGDR
jgi:cell division protein FtsB